MWNIGNKHPRMEILLLSQMGDFSALASSSSVPYIDKLINIASDFLEEVMRMRFRTVPILYSLHFKFLYPRGGLKLGDPFTSG